MSKRGHVPHVEIAPRVTCKHGEAFVEAWFPTSFHGDGVWHAVSETGLMEWPEGGLQQARYHAIEDEILERTFAAVRPAVAEAFTKAARKVLARERRRNRRDHE